MPLIEGNFVEVPDSIPPVAVGTYTFKVNNCEVAANNAGDGQNLVIEYEVADEGESKGRVLTKYYSLKPRSKNLHLVQIKRNFLSAQMELSDSGVDTDSLVGKMVRGEVEQNDYVDKRSGKAITGTALNKILIPGDDGYQV